ncbi:MAG: PAQR family membrane homeostasis protein TrhA [Bdellovibrionales bacterium]
MYLGERFNSITHLVGVFLAVSGVSVMMTLAALTRDPWKISSCAVFGACLIFLYGFSTLYHSVQGNSKKLFQKLDHIAIYLMIAGTYTPFTLVTLRESMGWWIFLAVWSLALFGIAQEIWRKPSPKRKLSLFLYLLMGWLIVSVSHTLYNLLDLTALIFLIAGGILYTGGVIFFVNDEKWKHAHGIWHLFVLGGSNLHFFCVLLFVI